MRSKQRPKSSISISPPSRSIDDDDRAIEGLPIRLVIALIVGVVSLGIMLQILGGIGEFGTNSEVDVDFPNDAHIQDGSNAPSSFKVKVVDENNDEVPEATVIATAGSARMDGALVRETSDDGVATFGFKDKVDVPPDADIATIEFDVQLPTDSDWVDDRPNNELIVTE